MWADGGVRHPRDVALALAAGAANVMVGSWFAGTYESPGDLHDDGRPALQGVLRHGLGARGQARTATAVGLRAGPQALFEEGISSSRMFLDPERPGRRGPDRRDHRRRPLVLHLRRRALVEELHERAVVGMQSAAGYEEGRPLHASW